MPLSEISVNTAGRHRNASRHEKPKDAMVKAHGEDQVGFDSSLASIHGMLKNTTETGDIGQFSIKSAPTPHPVSLVPAESPTYLHHHLNLPKHQVHQLEEYTYHGQRRADNWPRTSTLDYGGTGATSMVSLHHNKSQESFHLRPRQLANGPLGFSPSQSSHLDYSLSRHQSHTNLRPRSPFPYPTRLKRPNYRPSSPALTNLTGARLRTQGSREKVKTFRASSPLSLYARRRIPSSYRYDPNRSVPSLSYSHNTPPSPLTRFHDGAWSTPSGPSQGPTPQASSRQSTISYDGRFGENTAKEWTHQQSPSPIPLFYDYTEAFEEEYQYHSANLSVVSLVGQIIPENEAVETYHELEGDLGVLQPAELPGHHHASPASSKAFRHTVDSPSPSSIPGKVLTQMESWMSGEGDGVEHPSVEIIQRGNEDSQCEEGNKIGFKEGNEPGLSDADTMGHHILSSSKRRIETLSVPNPYRAVSCPNFRRDLVLPTPPLGDLSGPAEPPWEIPMVREDKNMPGSDTRRLSPQSWRIPSMDFGQLEVVPKEDVSEVVVSQASQNHAIHQGEYLGIRAPVPERPVSLQSQKDGLRRILSINEGSNHLAMVAKRCTVDQMNRPTSVLIADADAASVPNGSTTSPTEASNHVSVAARTPGPEGEDSNQSVTAQLSAPGGNREQPMQGRVSSTSNAGDSRTSSENLPRIDSRTAYPWTSMYQRTFHFPPAAARPKLYASISQKSAGSTLPTTAAQESHISRGSEDAPSISRTISFVSVPPRTSSVSERLPFSFTPLINAKQKPFMSAEAYHGPEGSSDARGSGKENRPVLLPKFKLKMRPEKSSRTLFEESQSGNLGGSKAVHASLHRLGFNMPESAVKPPKFRLKVTKPANSMNGTVRVRKGSAPSLTSLKQRWAGPSNLFQVGQSGESSTLENTTLEEASRVPAPIRTRFTEVLDSSSASPPFITLSPPSPGLHLTEVRSFFSDDSSQLQQEGSLRKRISQLKAIAGRASSMDDLRGADRKRSGSTPDRSRPAGRTSAQTGRSTVNLPSLHLTKSRVGEKIKHWWQRGEERLRDWGGRIKNGKSKSHFGNSELYAGV